MAISSQGLVVSLTFLVLLSWHFYTYFDLLTETWSRTYQTRFGCSFLCLNGQSVSFSVTLFVLYFFTTINTRQIFVLHFATRTTRRKGQAIALFNVGQLMLANSQHFSGVCLWSLGSSLFCLTLFDITKPFRTPNWCSPARSHLWCISSLRTSFVWVCMSLSRVNRTSKLITSPFVVAQTCTLTYADKKAQALKTHLNVLW